MIFQHETLHEASEVLEGAKYTMRTDILFYRSYSVLDSLFTITPEERKVFYYYFDKRYLEAVSNMYIQSDKILSHGDTLNSYKKFTEALLNQSKVRTQLITPIDPDLLLIIFSYLDIPSLASVIRVSI